MSMQDDEDDDEEEPLIPISRFRLIEIFITKLYQKKNVEKICTGDHMIIPITQIPNWSHDMGLLLGESIEDLLIEEYESLEEEEE